MKQPLQTARWLGLIAAGASLGFVVVPSLGWAATGFCLDCRLEPLADGMPFALLFSLIGGFESLRMNPGSRDAPVFIAAGGTGLLLTGLVILVRGMASPHGEAVVWAVSGAALVGASVAVFSSRIGGRSAAEPRRKS